MAFPAGAGIPVYDTAVAAITQTTSIANSAFSAGTIVAVAPSSTDIASYADAVLDVQMAVAPAANKAFYLYRRDKNLSGANHATVPSAAYKSFAVGSFLLAANTTRQYINLMDIPLSPDQEFYIENASGQATTGTTVLTIKPKSYVAKA